MCVREIKYKRENRRKGTPAPFPLFPQLLSLNRRTDRERERERARITFPDEIRLFNFKFSSLVSNEIKKLYNILSFQILH